MDIFDLTAAVVGFCTLTLSEKAGAIPAAPNT
jgi:hypothetical protein